MSLPDRNSFRTKTYISYLVVYQEPKVKQVQNWDGETQLKEIRVWRGERHHQRYSRAGIERSKGKLGICSNWVWFLLGKLGICSNWVWLLNVYAPCTVTELKSLWNDLCELKARCANCNFIDLPMPGKMFMWFGSKGNRSRLDRVLLESNLVVKFDGWSQEGLSRSISGQAPVECQKLIKGCMDQRNNSKAFSWKIYKLKGVLKKWNPEQCCNFDAKVKILEGKLNAVEENGNVRLLTYVEQEEIRKVRAELWEMSHLQEILGRQKSRLNWLSLVYFLVQVLGFVRMKNWKEADRVTQRLNGATFYGSMLVVKIARNNQVRGWKRNTAGRSQSTEYKK
ncbi:hypothetical protein GQ457_05G032800 [Hibiscus cannabinus]